MADEARCCPFLAFALGSEDRTLTITGPAGAKEILAGYSAFRVRTPAASDAQHQSAGRATSG